MNVLEVNVVTTLRKVCIIPSINRGHNTLSQFNIT